MTFKERLQELRTIDRRISSLMIEAESLRHHYRAVDSSKSKVQSSKNSDLSDLIVKIDRYNALINSEIDELYDRKIELKEIVNATLAGAYKEVIDLYYFQNVRTMSHVAAYLGYSRRQILRLHDKAIARLEQI